MLASDLPMSDDEDEEEVTNPDAVEGGRTSLQIVTVLAEGAFQFALPAIIPTHRWLRRGTEWPQ